MWGEVKDVCMVREGRRDLSRLNGVAREGREGKGREVTRVELRLEKLKC